MRDSKVLVSLASLAVLFGAAGVTVAKPPVKHAPATHAHPVAPSRATSGGAPAAKAPAGALNAAYTAYINRLRGKLDNNWYLADGSNKVVLSVDVAPDGSVTNLNITSSPQNTQAEQAASDAFNHSQPLDALPSGSAAVKLTLTFQSTADPHGDNSRTISGQIEAQVPATKPAGEANGGGTSGGGTSDQTAGH